MNFDLTDRAKDYQERVTAFMDEHIYPAEPVYERQMRDSGEPHFHPPILEELKEEARRRGLWNLFHPHPSGARASPTSSTRRWPRSWAGARTWRPRP